MELSHLFGLAFYFLTYLTFNATAVIPALRVVGTIIGLKGKMRNMIQLEANYTMSE